MNPKNLIGDILKSHFGYPNDGGYPEYPDQYKWTNFCTEIECFKCGFKQKVELKTKPFKHACKKCKAIHEVEVFVKIKLVDGGKNERN